MNRGHPLLPLNLMLSLSFIHNSRYFNPRFTDAERNRKFSATPEKG